jgi:hypothetical protein
MAWSLKNPVPRTNDVLQTQKGKIAQWWDNWFQEIAKMLDAANTGAVSLSAQSASVAATNITPDTPTASLAAGLYQISYSARITQAAGISSSLTPAFGWTDGGVACSFTGAAMTGNSTNTTQQAVIPIQVDAGTNVSYATTYASSGSPSMTYALRVRLELLP